MASTKQVTEILGQTGLLPPSTNRYTFLIEVVRSGLKPASTSGWLNVFYHIFTVVFAVETLLLLSCVLLIVTDSKSWLFQKGRNGIWVFHARTLWLTFSATFTAALFVDCLWQVLIDHGYASFRNKFLLEGCRFVPLFAAGWCFVMSILSQIYLSDVKSTKRLSQSESVARVRRERLLATGMNVSLVGVFILVCVSTISAFVVANTALNQCIDISSSIVRALASREASYDPGTFDFVRDAVPLLAPFSEFNDPLDRFRASYRIGWIFWACWSSLLAVFLVPVSLHHLIVLKNLMGERSLWSALSSPRSKRVSISIVNAKESEENTSLYVAANRSNEDLRAELRYLAFVTCIAALFVVLYTPLAIWAAVVPDSVALLQNEVFWTTQTLWVCGVWAIGALFFSTLFLQRLLNQRSQSRPTLKNSQPIKILGTINTSHRKTSDADVYSMTSTIDSPKGDTKYAGKF